MKDIRSLNKKKIALSEIEEFYKYDEYKTLYKEVIKLIDTGVIKPVKSSGHNGKSPALPLSYKVQMEDEDNTALFDEIKFKLSTKFDTGYYMRNIDKYKYDRQYILALNDYLANQTDKIKNRISINERSFEIWGREKFLGLEGGMKILNNLKFDNEYLNYYLTQEPLSYYSHQKTTPQNILIIENKDTFFSMRRHLLNGNKNIFGIEISTLIYGSGKGIIKSFKDFEVCAENYFLDKSNAFLYFGDLDYEGIVIYESLSRMYGEKYWIMPFINGYNAMVDKYKSSGIMELPAMKDGQNKNTSNSFFEHFERGFIDTVSGFLNCGRYIPQEILSIGDF
jgi:hypothetical protein